MGNAEQFYLKLKQSFSKGVDSMGEKAASSLDKNKSKGQVGTLEKEIQTLYTHLGQESYRLWQQNEFELEKLNPQLDAIKEKQDEIKAIEAHLEELARIAEEEKRAAEKETEAQANYLCENCGESYDEPFNFCRNCGTKREA